MGRHRYIPRAFTAILTLSLLAACSSSANSASPPATKPGSSSPTTATPATQTPTTARPACRPAPAYEPGTTTHDLTVAGVDREFLVRVPPHPRAAMRLVVDFHGAGSNMAQQDIYSGFDALADKKGFVVATPNGIEAAIRQWRYLGTLDDVNFAKAIIGNLAKNACVDPAHAYATGISSGGAMTASLACQASDAFAGFGPVAADFYLPQICAKARIRPIIIFHGTADPVVPYKGGQVGTSGVPVGGAEATAAAWAGHNGCTPGPTRTGLGSQVVRLSWNGCKAPVVMYSIVGGGHTWPGSVIDVTRLGLTTHQVSATNQMWKFFSAYG